MKRFKFKVLRRFIRCKRALRRAKWWFLHRLHPSHRYHIVKTGLRPGWHDRDMVMAILIIKMVVDFVELEKPYEWFETEIGPHAKEWEDLKKLYNYFKKIDVFDLCKDDRGYDELNERLVEAIELRHMLYI